jgi:lipopolysaccharide/colanic/teichoic acid biosynthesis glycosyltransferase
VIRRISHLLPYAGIAATIGLFSKLHASVVAGDSYDFTNSFRLPWAIGLGVAFSAAAYLGGFPDQTRRLRATVGAAVVAVLLAAVGFSLVQFVLGAALLPRFVVVASMAVLAPWFVLCSRLDRDGRVRANDRDRIVVVGHPEETVGLAREVEQAERPARVVAVLTPEEAAPPQQLTRLRTVVADTGATLLVLDRQAQARQAIVDQAAFLHEEGVRVRTMSLFYEEWLGKLPLGELERMSLLFDIGEVHRRRYGRQRRVLDVALALIGAVALIVVTPLVMLGNRIANRGPLLFRQVRVGQNGRPFTIYKFRTMATGGLDDTSWTVPDDPRITRFGGFLRATHLDELPQVANVLAADLAIVGPRPEQPHYVEELSAKLPFYNVRHLVRPGLTGWAQVKHGYAGHEQDALQKLQYEFFYLRHQGLALDARIVARTARSVLSRRGR